MRYISACFVNHCETEIYRIYVTDMLYHRAQRKTLTVRYEDVIHPKPVDNRTGDEIAEDVIKRLGLRIKE